MHGVALHLCQACERPFVVPESIMDVVDEGIYLVAFECKNCARASLGVIEDAHLEELERELDRAAAELAIAADLAEVKRQIEEIDRFAHALRDGHILPEDF